MRAPISDQKPVFERVDLEQYLEEHNSNTLDKDQQETEIQIFKNALDFSKVKARECMIPRNEIVAMELNDDIDLLRDKFVETGFSKIVIYKENIDYIIGYTHSYELFKKPKDIKSILLPIAMLPESMTANDILNLFLKERKSIALVVDEFGGTSGLVTVEDVVEEIFGEIQDEHDSPALLEKQISEDEFVFSGRSEVDYLNEKYQLNLPQSNDYETLSGLIVHHCEDIPETREEISMEGFRFVVLSVDQTRIEKVKLIRQD
jgi:CBS domain containing-hemolysin-like protein